MILDTFPSAEEFYKTYWGKKPFIVRGFIPAAIIDQCIDGDTLAGLSLEEDLKSRIITNNAAGNDWTCEHGPFDDDRFDDIGDKNWSLLVQNVEQYHVETSQLLTYFNASPRWLLDDIMVSFSAPGGSVGPHTDSYHTFLVQGIGKRTWKISNETINDKRFADNPDVKVLKHGFDGEVFEVECGDVIYMPPFFGHEGKTIDAAMTFSIGFLGPKLSEMLGDYAQYLAENEEKDHRFLGDALTTQSANLTISPHAQNSIKSSAINAIQSDDFARWMAGYFAKPTHDDSENIDMHDEPLTETDMQIALDKGQKISRQQHVKIVITTHSDGGFSLSVFGDIIPASQSQKPLMDKLNTGEDITALDLSTVKDNAEALSIITALHNQNALSF